MVDAKSYGYTVDEMKLFIAEAAKSGMKVAGHVQTRAGALRAIEAGIWSIEHSGALDDETHKLMAQKGNLARGHGNASFHLLSAQSGTLSANRGRHEKTPMPITSRWPFQPMPITTSRACPAARS